MARPTQAAVTMASSGENARMGDDRGAGYVLSCVSAAAIYAQGTATEADRREAERCGRKACRLGHKPSCTEDAEDEEFDEDDGFDEDDEL